MWSCDLGWVCVRVRVHILYILCVNYSIMEPSCMPIKLKWFSLKNKCVFSACFSPFPISILHHTSLYLLQPHIFFLLWAFCCLVFFLNSQRLFLPLLHSVVPIFDPLFPISRTSHQFQCLSVCIHLYMTLVMLIFLCSVFCMVANGWWNRKRVGPVFKDPSGIVAFAHISQVSPCCFCSLVSPFVSTCEYWKVIIEKENVGSYTPFTLRTQPGLNQLCVWEG